MDGVFQQWQQQHEGQTMFWVAICPSVLVPAWMELDYLSVESAGSCDCGASSTVHWGIWSNHMARRCVVTTGLYCCTWCPQAIFFFYHSTWNSHRICSRSNQRGHHEGWSDCFLSTWYIRSSERETEELLGSVLPYFFSSWAPQGDACL